MYDANSITVRTRDQAVKVVIEVQDSGEGCSRGPGARSILHDWVEVGEGTGARLDLPASSYGPADN